MIATKIGFLEFQVHFDPIKLRISHLLFYTVLHEIVRSFYFIGIGQNVDISSSKRL